MPQLVTYPWLAHWIDSKSVRLEQHTEESGVTAGLRWIIGSEYHGFMLRCRMRGPPYTVPATVLSSIGIL